MGELICYSGDTGVGKVAAGCQSQTQSVNTGVKVSEYVLNYI